MEKFDLNGLYEQFLLKKVRENPAKYANAEALENDIPVLAQEWENTEESELDGKTPKQFAQYLAQNKMLFDYIVDCLEAGKEVSDVLCFKLLEQPDCVESCKQLIYGDSVDGRSLGAVLLREKGGAEAVDAFLEALTARNASDEVKQEAYEFLREDADDSIVDKILALINDAAPDTQKLLTEILSGHGGRKEVFFWLVTMLYRAEDIPLFSGLLGAYGDKAAVDVLNNFAAEYDINYVDFLEIRNAIERLGGEVAFDKDFTDDEYFKFMHRPDENSDSGETTGDKQ